MKRSRNDTKAWVARLCRVTLCWPLLLAFACSLNAQEMTRQQLSDSAKHFAQEFYSWYVRTAQNEHAAPAWDFALKHRSSAFSPELLRALKEDSAAQANSPGEIVGLDFDPFLASQDPEDRYEVGKVTQKGKSYWVEVYGVRSGKRIEPAAVLAELLRRNGHWTFVNFHYPGPYGNDLLSILKLLREDRQKSAQ